MTFQQFFLRSGWRAVSIFKKAGPGVDEQDKEIKAHDGDEQGGGDVDEGHGSDLRCGGSRLMVLKPVVVRQSFAL